MRGRQRISKELLEVKAESEERIIALQDALQEKESRLATAKGEVLEIREQLEAQEERRKGNPKREAQATEWEERPQDKPMRDRQEGDTSGDRELQGVFMVPPGSRRNYRRWPAPTAKQGKKGCCRERPRGTRKSRRRRIIEGTDTHRRKRERRGWSWQ